MLWMCVLINEYKADGDLDECLLVKEKHCIFLFVEFFSYICNV